jgi:predicted glycogen debranching enzyme
MIGFEREHLSSLEFATSREWLETNGLGGFASSTIVGLNTRRYHGLLVAATDPPAGRMVLLSRLEETLVIGDRRYDLSCNQYPGVVHPAGHQYLSQFRLDPFPVWTYELEHRSINKSLFMVHGENTTAVHYQVNGLQQTSSSCRLEIRPLVAFRDYHSTTHMNQGLNPTVHQEPGLCSIMPYPGLPVLYFAHNASELEAAASSACWFYDFEYAVERERGLDFREDLFSPCVMRFNLDLFSEARLIVSTERQVADSISEMRQSEVNRRNAISTSSPHTGEFVTVLVEAADQYIVDRGAGKTVIAGYHWFGDWGRDTMISLTGLTLATGRYDVAKSILKEFSLHVDRGMLPNRYPDTGEAAEYNTVDATLWYFEAVRALADYCGDYEFIRTNLYDVLVDIVGWHVRGTRYGIRMDEDGLLAAGADGAQLTWMDAKVADRVITPRHGKPVEIQALWYNALRTMEMLASRFGEEASARNFGEMASEAKVSFTRLFWNDKLACLYDVVNGDWRDPSIRPNQLFAVSLCHSMLEGGAAKLVVETVERHLLTPYGLRTLSPSDPQYRGRYEGNPGSRDSAYHQGTVWPWLIGPFITAYLRVNGSDAEHRQNALRLLTGLREHLQEAGLGQISEIFDGDDPHRPAGCIAQAWSVAEILRALVENVLELKAETPNSS